MKIDTGNGGGITILALLGIWSVSALTSLPGIAISPILGNLTAIFKKATELEIQMLTSLPSLLIIPFILLAGRISETIGYMRLLYLGLSIFLLSGILYFFCDTITELVFVSALLGVGAGIITPFSTSLVSRFFSGEARVKQFGYTSAINNLALVIATAVAGYLSEIEWRLSFVVYLLPVLSLFLVRYVKIADDERQHCAATKETDGRIDYRALSKLMLYYLLITFLVMVVSVNLPFLMNGYGYDSGASGDVISLFFLFIMLPGFFLNKLLSFMREGVFRICLFLIGCGLLVIFFNKGLTGFVIGVLLSGVGYGIAQPCLYERVSGVATGSGCSFALALLMTMNYVAIVICPPIIDFFQGVLGVNNDDFAFAFNSIVCLLALLLLQIRRLCF